MATRYNSFDELPRWVKDTVCKMRAGDERIWVFQPVPALDGQSVIALMNEGESGEQRVRAYLNTVIGKFL